MLFITLQEKWQLKHHLHIKNENDNNIICNYSNKKIRDIILGVFAYLSEKVGSISKYIFHRVMYMDTICWNNWN
jgi:hypothetical protein